MENLYHHSHYLTYTFDCFFKILGSIIKKFGQILVLIMPNISNSSLVLLRRAETRSKPFHDFDKNVVLCNLLVLLRWYLLILIVPVHNFKKPKNHKLFTIGLQLTRVAGELKRA